MVVLDKLLMKAIQSYMGYYLSNFDKKTMKLGLLSGELVLNDMEVNPEFLKDMMLVQNLSVKKVKVDALRVKFPWTNLKNESIVFEMDTVDCEVEEGFEYVPPKVRKPSSYGFIGRCFDSVTVKIKQINTFVTTMDGVPDCEKPRRVRQTLTNLQIISTNEKWEVCPLKETFFRSPDKKCVIFYKKLTCEKFTFGVETEDPKTGEKYFAEPLRDVPLTIQVRIKKEISDGEVLCGEIGMGFGHLHVTFKEHEWQNMFDVCRGFVASFTKKIAPPGDAANAKPASAKPVAKKEPKAAPKDAVIKEEDWADLKSGLDDFHQTRFMVTAEFGSVAMLENEAKSEDQDPDCYAKVLFEDMSWTCTLAPYGIKKQKALERAKSQKSSLFGRKKTEVVEQVPSVIIRKKLAAMVMAMGKVTIVSSKDGRHTVLLGSKPEGEVKVKKAKKKEEKSKGKGKKEKAEVAVAKPFVELGWTIRTETPDESDIEAWLRSLVVDMTTGISDANLVFDRPAWFRILQFMNIGATATTLADASSTLELRIHGLATNVTMLMPDAGQVLDDEDPTRGCLLFNADRVVMGSDVGVAKDPAFDGGVFRRLTDASVPFPADEKLDFTLGERFSIHDKPRKFQFDVTGATGILDGKMIMDPVAAHVSFHLQKYFDKLHQSSTTEHFNAYLQLEQAALRVTEEQYVRFYTTVAACWDDLRAEFGPEELGGLDAAVDVSDSNEGDKTIPYRSYMQAFIRNIELHLYDNDVYDVQRKHVANPEAKWPQAAVQAGLHHVECVSEILAARKVIFFRIAQALVHDEDSKLPAFKEDDIAIPSSAILGRFQFNTNGQPANCQSEMRIQDVRGKVDDGTLGRAEQLLATLRGLGIECDFDEAHNKLEYAGNEHFLLNGERVDTGLPPIVADLVPMMLPFWRSTAAPSSK